MLGPPNGLSPACAASLNRCSRWFLRASPGRVCRRGPLDDRSSWRAPGPAQAHGRRRHARPSDRLRAEPCLAADDQAARRPRRRAAAQARTAGQTIGEALTEPDPRRALLRHDRAPGRDGRARARRPEHQPRADMAERRARAAARRPRLRAPGVTTARRGLSLRRRVVGLRESQGACPRRTERG